MIRSLASNTQIFFQRLWVHSFTHWYTTQHIQNKPIWIRLSNLADITRRQRRETNYTTEPQNPSDKNSEAKLQLLWFLIKFYKNSNHTTISHTMISTTEDEKWRKFWNWIIILLYVICKNVSTFDFRFELNTPHIWQFFRRNLLHQCWFWIWLVWLISNRLNICPTFIIIFFLFSVLRVWKFVEIWNDVNIHQEETFILHYIFTFMSRVCQKLPCVKHKNNNHSFSMMSSKNNPSEFYVKNFSWNLQHFEFWFQNEIT